MVERVWDVAVLVTTLLALAGVAIVALAPFLFEAPPRGLVRARPIVFALVGLAGALLLVEWLVVHKRSL